MQNRLQVEPPIIMYLFRVENHESVATQNKQWLMDKTAMGKLQMLTSPGRVVQVNAAKRLTKCQLLTEKN